MILLVLPHQLYQAHPGVERKPSLVVLVEDSLLFGDRKYPARFHKQKLWLHRASMKRFQARLENDGLKTLYLEYNSKQLTIDEQLGRALKHAPEKDKKLCVIEPSDFILRQRIDRACKNLGLKCEYLANPGFFNSPDDNASYREGKKRWFMADFYKWQRQRLDILMEGDEPAGGQWSFDEDNRKKVPKKQLSSIPELAFPERDEIDLQARDHVNKHFAGNPGSLDELFYPTCHDSAERWLQDFLRNRFDHFGDFEDAIVEGESWLWHSVLTPALNVGLLTPQQIVKAALDHARKHEIPLNSLEGFLRQIIGWREFMRATYEDLGVEMRTGNHWNHRRGMPDCFYDASTGIPPIDDTIERLLKTGYCHHIERLMVLGGFMFICEIDPDAIYRWFMEMFVDSYDWVMVPNVYAMSQHADGGLITTKPYFSGSSYIRKMSHYRNGDWCEVWDGLYWRWIWKHVDELGKNPRWAMMCAMASKMDKKKRDRHLERAESFLEQL